MMATMPREGSKPITIQAAHLVKAFSRLRDLHPDMTLLQALFLFYVAANPGCNQRAVYDALNTTDSNAARTLALLSDIGGRKTPPLDVIKITINSQDRRERLLDLTPKGRRLMLDLLADLGKKGDGA